ncbi:MAG: preprotein translocase subunit SecA [Xanthomonadales bacterium PRO6]|nr:Protein translocase subunit SecA [Xanthomonadales bacterium]MCE7931658.1 preprotein translocase subunit SecA [Xanthomonadales bacterium PRO6]
MLNALLTRIFGSRNDRVIRGMRKTVARINELEPSFQALSDEALKAKTIEFRERLAKGETEDQLLPEAFAAVREAARRTLGLRHYDVQLIGGMVLHQGKIAEMRTGEGKTLVATLPVYLNALPGKGVHVVTVNDYLAKRDAAWMGPVYAMLGMTVGVIVPGQSMESKRQSYACDITYGTNNEYGFDYLRTNMAFQPADRLQRGQHYAIVDEVDSILIDEARTPLIISGPADESPELYLKINRVAPLLKRQKTEEDDGDFWVDEKQKQVHLSEAGMKHVEEILAQHAIIKPEESLYDVQNLAVVHHLNAALRALHLYQRDVDYIVRDGEVIIVDEFTGRTLPGRRWSDGLHQAIEAKEAVPIQRENQTLASITFQNYFRMYKKLSGMTGTADTEAFEFNSIYGLEVIVIPTHRPMIRKDATDLVFLTRKDKYAAIIDDIRERRARKQPVLVGTTSIEISELLAGMLKKEGISHEVLNAKQHEREAHIVAQAGRPGAVTIATNMAGRGTDIVLGGSLEAELHALGAEVTDAQKDAVRAEWKLRHEEVLKAGGLHIVGTERHESRRIDNQLRGRSGRQGDPGSSRFYLAFEDSLMRIFASERLAALMQRLGMKEGESIEHPLVNRAIENAQRKVEAHNFDIRKHLLDFDDVANDQRKVIYEQRNEIMDAADVQETLTAVRHDVVRSMAAPQVPPESIDEQWNLDELKRTFMDDLGVEIEPRSWVKDDPDINAEGIVDKVIEAVDRHFRERETVMGTEIMRMAEKAILLNVLDAQWKDHLARMDYLRQGIHLRGYAQKQPKQEFKREAFELFQQLLEKVKSETIRMLARVRIRSEDDIEQAEARRVAPPMKFQHPDAGNLGADDEAAQAQGLAPAGWDRADVAPVSTGGHKVGRNDPCPCGSGKKYKACHGRLD